MVMTLIHILYSYFTEIVYREVDETMRCFGDKKTSQNAFFSAILTPGAVQWVGSISWPPRINDI